MQELGVLSDYVDPESNDWEEVPWGSRRVFVPYINKISIPQADNAFDTCRRETL